MNPADLLDRYASQVRPFVDSTADVPPHTLLALVCAALIARGVDNGRLAASLLAMAVNLPLRADELDQLWLTAIKNKPPVRVMQPMGSA